MNIIYQNVTAQLGNHSFIRAIYDNTILLIPKNESNTDYQEYLKWVAEGNVAEEYQPE
jgi:hypothetical protein